MGPCYLGRGILGALETNIPGWNNDPWEFNDITSDGSDIYAQPIGEPVLGEMPGRAQWSY